MKLIARIIGNLIFVAAFALSVKLAWELHANEIVPLGVAGLALVMSAFGLLFARNSWIDGAKPEWILGLFMWIVGAGAFTITEWGFWFSSYTERHAEYQEIKKAKTRAEGVKDQAWAALMTGQVPKTSAQLQADLDAKKLDPIYMRSASCTDATLPDSRAFCTELFALKSEHASVKKRESLEQQVQASEGPTKKTLIHDVFAQAEWLSSLLGISEKTAATIIILGSWLVLLVCRDTGILIANPPRRVKATAKPVAPIIPRKPYTPSLTLPVKSATPAVTETPLPPEPEPTPDGDGTPAETTPDSVPEPTTVVNFPVQTPPKALSKRDQAKQKKERVKHENRKLVEAYVVDRLDTEHPRAQIELTPKGGWKAGGSPGDQVYQDFRIYCKHRGIKRSIGRNWFGEFVGEFVDRAKGSKGVVYGAVIVQPAAKKRAA